MLEVATVLSVVHVYLSVSVIEGGYTCGVVHGSLV